MRSTIQTHAKYWRTLVLVVLFLAACGASPAVAPANTFTQAYKVLSLATVAGLTEQHALAGPARAAVLKLAYLATSNQVLVVYTGGQLLDWDNSTSTVLARHPIEVATAQGLEFNQSGSLLLAAGAQFSTTRDNQLIERIARIALWDTASGKQIQCLSFRCDPAIYPVPNLANPEWRLGAILDRTGNWTLDYSEDGIFILDRGGGTGAQSIQVNSMDADYWWQIGRIVFDDARQRYAIIYQEGRIELSALNPTTIGPFALPNHVVAAGTQLDQQPIPAASFDSTGHWLAVVRGSVLSLWQVDQGKQYTLNQSAQNLAGLSFDQSGKLLFVGTSDQVAVWDVDRQTRLTTLATPGISTLAISQDNRLLLWGDTQGTTHIWAAPSQDP